MGTAVLADGVNETLVSWQQTDTRLELRRDSKRQTRWKLPPKSGIPPSNQGPCWDGFFSRN